MPARLGPLQPFLKPDQLLAFVIHDPAFLQVPPVNKQQAPAHMTPAKLADAPGQLLLINRHKRYRPALDLAVLTGQPTGTTPVHQDPSCRTQTALRHRSGLNGILRKLLRLRQACA